MKVLWILFLVNKQGTDPIKPYLAKVDEIKTKKDIETYLTNMAPYGGGGFYGFWCI